MTSQQPDTSPRGLDALVPRFAAEFPAYEFGTQRTWRGIALVAVRHDRNADRGLVCVITDSPAELREALGSGTA